MTVASPGCASPPGLCGGPARDRADAGEQQPLAEWLGDVVIGAERQAGGLVLLLVLAGEEDHRQVGMFAQPAEQLHPVHPRHLDVEYRQIGRILGERLKGGFAV